MMRGLLFIVIAIVCASCRTDAQLDPIQTTPIIDAAEINAREDCLYREVARLLEVKGSPLTSLQNAAVTATRFCSEAIRTRFQRASVSAPDAQTSREMIKSRQNTVPSPSVWNCATKGQTEWWPIDCFGTRTNMDARVPSQVIGDPSSKVT